MRAFRALFALPLLAGCSADVSEPLHTAQESKDAGPTTTETVDAAVPPVSPACEPLNPRTVPLEMAALPDAGETPFVSALSKATTEIKVMVYQMGYGGILDTLKAKAEAKIPVQVILDVGQKDVNDKYKTTLEASGAIVKWSDPKFPYMHAKLMIVDGKEAVISTGNYSKSYMLKERNFVATDRDPADLEILKNLFDADFAGTSPDLSCTRMLVSPVNAKSRLIDFIKSAKSTLLIESMQFGDYTVRDAVLERAKAGVSVRVLLADPGWIDTNQEAFDLLAKNGIPALTRPNLHVKAIVVDGKSGYIGSENLSSTSLNKNREVGLLTDDPTAVGTLVSTFESDWKIGTTP